MRAFAHASRAPHPASARARGTPAPSPVLHAQHARAVPESPQAERADPATGASPRSGHDFSRITVHAPAPLPIQPKLAMNAPGDVHEVEADRISKDVMQMPAVRLQRACPCGGRCPECRKRAEAVQTRRVQHGAPESVAAPPIVHEVLAGPGRPLEPSVRDFMEPRLGHDFSRVRVHTDERAAESARAMDAMAYTVGRNLVFDSGRYEPGTSTGRQLLAHELTHTIQQGAVGTLPGLGGAPAYATNTAGEAVQRAMKFELQTSNLVWRTKGTSRSLLPRKFGPDKVPKHKDFLHKGTRGKAPTATEEGTAVELQSEAHGFVEFETPSWHRDWCEVKERIQEAVDMVDTINKSKVVSTTGGVKTVEFPFDTKHLAWSKDFTKGLTAGEKLEVEIKDPDWSAKIQASESFELSQFESYLKEHIYGPWFTSITGSAKKIVDAANTAKLPDKDLVNLRSLMQIIIETLTSVRYFNPTYHGSLAKEQISLMSRTNFSSIYGTLLSKDEQSLFRAIVKSKAVLKEFGVTDKTLVFEKGYKGLKKPGPTIHEWLVSIHTDARDKLSSIGGDNRAMGRFDVETTPGKKDTNLVKFEARGTSGHVQDRPAHDQKHPTTGVLQKGGWVHFAEEVFKDAATKRARTGKTALEYDPSKC